MKINYLNKITLLISVILLITGCEKKFNTVIDPQLNVHELRLISMYAPDSLILKDTTDTIVAQVKISAPDFVKEVFFDVYTPDNQKLNPTKILMFDDGKLNTDGDKRANDSIFSNVFTFRESNPNGRYNLKFYATDLRDNQYLLGIKLLYFKNGAVDYPPRIFNLIIPDSINRGVEFLFSVEVADSNGLQDIPDGGVFYQLNDPSGKLIVNSRGISRFPLSDKGDTNVSGDETANDGVFTQKLKFPTNQPTGKWKFTFQAMDKSDSTSNILIHYLNLK